MEIPQIVVSEFCTTFRANGIVSNDIDGFGDVCGQPADAVKCARIVLFQHAAAQFVCVQDQFGGVGAVGVDDTENVVRMGVSLQ